MNPVEQQRLHDMASQHNLTVSLHENLDVNFCGCKGREPSPGQQPRLIPGMDGPSCPNCGGMTQRTGTCATCVSCGSTTGCG